MKSAIFSSLVLFFSLTSIHAEFPDTLGLIPALGTEEVSNRLQKPIWMGENPGAPGTFLVAQQHLGTVSIFEKESGNFVKKHS